MRLGRMNSARFCYPRCGQAARRFGSRCPLPVERSLSLAYADPLPNRADHRAVLRRLATFDGWALSTSEVELPAVLAICVELQLTVRVAAWVRGPLPTASATALNSWEPVLYKVGRRVDRYDPIADVLLEAARPRLMHPLRVIGPKPPTFNAWVFELLGALPGDDFTDLFPATGGFGRAWDIYSRQGSLAARRERARLLVESRRRCSSDGARCDGTCVRRAAAAR